MYSTLAKEVHFYKVSQTLEFYKKLKDKQKHDKSMLKVHDTWIPTCVYTMYYGCVLPQVCG